jgi:thiol-disulfide isomerase/thioredoxin
MNSGSFKDAAGTAEAMEPLCATPALRSVNEYRRASALFEAAGEKAKPDKLEAVHGLLQQALTNYPKNGPALFLDGKVMARLGKMDEARADFSQCLSCVGPKDPSRLRAEHFAENPELSLHKMAPAFEVTAMDGSKFNLDAMGGRVVLIDFWATWCGPCNRELPHMKQIAKEFAGQPLVILSVSWDQDEGKWKDFIAKNEMTWLQYRDPDHKLSDQFGINSIPHYFTIDSDGVLTAEMVGEGSNVEGKLKKLLAKAREAQKETVAGVGSVPSGN